MDFLWAQQPLGTPRDPVIKYAMYERAPKPNLSIGAKIAELCASFPLRVLCTNLQRRSWAEPPSRVCRTRRSASHRNACPGSWRWPRCRWPSRAERRALVGGGRSEEERAHHSYRSFSARPARTSNIKTTFWPPTLTWNKEHDASSEGAIEPLEGGKVGEGEDSRNDAGEARHSREDHESASGVPVGWGHKQRVNRDSNQK